MTHLPCFTTDSANAFLHYLNSCHRNIKFTIEFEQNNAIPFLDILVTRIQNNAFVTSIYRKKTFTGLYTKWDSFTPRKYKINLIRSLTYRYYRLCSSGSLLQSSKTPSSERLPTRRGHRGLLETKKPRKKSPKTAKPQEISSKTENRIKLLTHKALVVFRISLSFLNFNTYKLILTDSFWLFPC